MRCRLYIALILWVMTISGCASANYIHQDYSGKDAGYAIISIGRTKDTNYAHYELFFRKKDDKDTFSRIRYAPFFRKKKTDIEGDNSICAVRLLSLPPGEYEIYNFDVFSNLGIFQANYGAEVDFSIPFTVRPHEATYLGEYIANKLGGPKGQYWSTGGAYFIVKKKIKRDLEYVKKSCPNVKFAKITNSTPVAFEIGCPLIRSSELKK